MEERWDDWIRAGRITCEALEYGRGLIKPGVSVIEVCRSVERRIVELGGVPAFPVQVSLNETAAHFCPEDASLTFSDQVVKLDAGAHVNGAIGDSAVTVDLSGKYADLVKAAQDALNAAVKEVRVGVRLSDIGRTIQETIEGFGYQPVRNLSGHGLGRFTIHTSPTIPNFDTHQDAILEEGMTIAIEPFATTGAGMIHEHGTSTLFSLQNPKPVRLQMVRDILTHAARYEGLPFTTWWLSEKFSEAQVRFALAQLKQFGMVESYPPLVEVSGGIVSQAEHSVIVLDKPIITTIGSK